MSARRVTLLLCCVVSLTACGSRAATNASVPLSLPVGELPSSLPPSPSGDLVPPGPTGPTTTLPRKEQAGARAKGNRVILLGDSVTASTSQRYTNDMCKALVPLGWRAEVDAESGRFIEFGNKVLDARLSAGWDAAVVLLGNNYVENQDNYRKQLERIVTRLSPRPIVLLTVTEIRTNRQQVNAVIRSMPKLYPNVQIVEWALITRDTPGLTGADHLHLTNVGRAALASAVAEALGAAPASSPTLPAKCLPTNYTDDSMMPVTGTSVPGTGGSTETTHKGTTTSTAGSSEASTTVKGTTPPSQSTAAPTTTANGGPGKGGG